MLGRLSAAPKISIQPDIARGLLGLSGEHLSGGLRACSLSCTTGACQTNNEAGGQVAVQTCCHNTIQNRDACVVTVTHAHNTGIEG